MAAGATIWGKTGYTFGQVYKCPAPPNRERLITISRSDLSNLALVEKLQVIQFHRLHPDFSKGMFLKALYVRKSVSLYT